MDTGHSVDRPHEADHTSDAKSRTHLAALGECLKGQFDVELTDDGLVVRHRSRPGNVVTIICRRRPTMAADGGSSPPAGGGPIADVDSIPDTVVAIHGYLAGDRS
jgi:hypothetical protein